MKIAISEPVSVLNADYGLEPFSYYLNSATDISDLNARYIHVASKAAPQPRQDTITLRYYNEDVLNPTPHKGDYVRFRADALIWADTSNGAADGADTLRQATDGDWHWNSPTSYNAAEQALKRLPSPWVLITGASQVSVNTISYNIADPSRITPETPVGEVFPVKTTENMDQVKEAHPGTLGHLVKSDMGSILGEDQYASLDKSTVFFYYEVDYFTNLGGFVARQSGKIYCTDPFFSPDPATATTGDCVKYPRNFFIAWNMLSDNHRLVGTGAYITKFTSYMKLGEKGKTGKQERTEVWGVKRGKGFVK